MTCPQGGANEALFKKMHGGADNEIGYKLLNDLPTIHDGRDLAVRLSSKQVNFPKIWPVDRFSKAFQRLLQTTTQSTAAAMDSPSGNALRKRR